MGGLLKARVAAAVIAMTLLLHVFSVVARIGRAPGVDEIEYLHGSWLMAHGGTLYQSFFEHHSPLLFAMFVPFAPEELADPLPYVMTARAMAGAAGLIALVLLAMVAWRFSPVAAAIAVSLTYSAEWLWTTGLAEARAEPFGMALMWGAIALLLLPRRVSPLFPGLAMGLMSLAALLNPKWPLVTLVLTVYALAQLVRMGWKRAAIGIAIAAAFAGGGMAVLLCFARLGDWWFYSFPFNVALARWASTSADLHQFFLQYGRFSRLPWFARPLVALAIAAIAVAGFRPEKRIVLIVIALAAALAENRVLHSYPHLWPQYFIFPTMLGALLAGLVPDALERLLPKIYPARLVANGLLVLVAVSAFLASLPWTRTRSPYWVSAERLRQRMKPGETVWVVTPEHPITVRDANYYWFLPEPVMESTRSVDPSRVRGSRRFPICAAAAGEDGTVRFISELQATGMPEELRCLQQMLSDGKLRPATGARLVEVQR